MVNKIQSLVNLTNELTTKEGGMNAQEMGQCLDAYEELVALQTKAMAELSQKLDDATEKSNKYYDWWMREAKASVELGKKHKVVSATMRDIASQMLERAKSELGSDFKTAVCEL